MNFAYINLVIQCDINAISLKCSFTLGLFMYLSSYDQRHYLYSEKNVLALLKIMLRNNLLQLKFKKNVSLDYGFQFHITQFQIHETVLIKDE